LSDEEAFSGSAALIAHIGNIILRFDKSRKPGMDCAARRQRRPDFARYLEPIASPPSGLKEAARFA
jgi:hypothetical protein